MIISKHSQALYIFSQRNKQNYNYVGNVETYINKTKNEMEQKRTFSIQLEVRFDDPRQSSCFDVFWYANLFVYQR